VPTDDNQSEPIHSLEGKITVIAGAEMVVRV
jgi:hypothetical protein